MQVKRPRRGEGQIMSFAALGEPAFVLLLLLLLHCSPKDDRGREGRLVCLERGKR